MFVLMASGGIAAPLAIAAPAATDASEGTPQERLAALEDANAIIALHERLVQDINARTGRSVSNDIYRLTADPAGAVIEISRAVVGNAATSRARYVVLRETPMEVDCMLVQMARLQGEGIVRHTERCILENTYIKHEGIWKVEETVLRPGETGEK